MDSELSGKVKDAISKLKSAIDEGVASGIEKAVEDLKKPLYEMTTAAYKAAPSETGNSTQSSDNGGEQDQPEGEASAESEQ